MISKRICNECDRPVYAKLKCAYHYKMPSAINPKPLIRTSKPIRQVSKKKAKELAEYSKVKAEYFKLNPVCEYPSCQSTDVQLHHRAGRIGSLLTDIRYFCSLCHDHHQYVELQPIKAKELGLSINSEE